MGNCESCKKLSTATSAAIFGEIEETPRSPEADIEHYQKFIKY